MWICVVCSENNPSELFTCSSCSLSRPDSNKADIPTWAWACPRPGCGIFNLELAQFCASCDSRRHGTRFRTGKEASETAAVATARATYETRSETIHPTISSSISESKLVASISPPRPTSDERNFIQKPNALTSLRSPNSSEPVVEGTLRGLGLKRPRNEDIYEEYDNDIVEDEMGVERFEFDNEYDNNEEEEGDDDDDDDDIVIPYSRRKERTRRYKYIDDDESSEEKEKIIFPKPKVQVLSVEEVQALRSSRLNSLLEKTADIMSRLSLLISKHQNDTRLLREHAELAATTQVVDESEATKKMKQQTILSPQLSPSLALLSNVPPSQPSLISGCTMHDYQIQGLAWLVSMYDADLNGILADEMGLGKTLQVLSLFAHLAEKRGIFGPHLVVVPLSVLSNWKNDALKFSPLLASRMHLHHGGADERKFALADFFSKLKKRGKNNFRKVHEKDKNQMDERETHNDENVISDDPRLGDLSIVVTTYEMAIRDETLLKKTRWFYCVVDEGHRLKNVQSRLGASLRALCIPRRLLLTGTPLQNNLQELWSLLNFCLPSLFNSSDNFEEWFAAPFDRKVLQSSTVLPDSTSTLETPPSVTLSLSNEERIVITTRLHEVLRPFFLRRLKSEVTKDLPSRTESVILCPMSALQAALYDRTRAGLRQYIDPTSGSTGRIFTLSNLFMRLRQVCNHPYLLSDEWSVAPDLIRSSGKFEVLHRLLPKLVIAGRRILLFSQMTSVLDLIEDLISMLNLSFVRLDGQTKPSERSQLIDEFNAKDSLHKVFLLSTRAGGVGVNLHSADTVIIFDSDWNPQMDLQAMSRAHRLGQTKDVHVIRLISKGPVIVSKHLNGRGGSVRSVEMLMHQRAQQKLETEAAVIGAGRFHHGSIHIQQEEEENKSPRTNELVRACLSDDFIDQGISKFEQDILNKESRTKESSKDSRTFSSLSTLSISSSSLRSSPLSSLATASLEKDSKKIERVVYSSLSNVFLNAQCSRDANDLEAFEKWDAHYEKRIENAARSIAIRKDLDDRSAIEQLEKKRYFFSITFDSEEDDNDDKLSTLIPESSLITLCRSTLPVLANLVQKSSPILLESPVSHSTKMHQLKSQDQIPLSLGSLTRSSSPLHHGSRGSRTLSSPIQSIHPDSNNSHNSLVGLAHSFKSKKERRASGLGLGSLKTDEKKVIIKRNWRSLVRANLSQGEELVDELKRFVL
jgi:SNF2 family DNA or RNA helicase